MEPDPDGARHHAAAADLHRLLVVRGGVPGAASLRHGPAPPPRSPARGSGLRACSLPQSPSGATIPADRLLTFVGIGAAGLLARFWEFVFGAEGAPSNPWWRIPARAVAWFLVAVHAVIAPITLPMRAANPVGPGWVEERLYVHTPLGTGLEDRTVVIVNAPSAVNASYFILRRDAGGQSIPRHTRVLAPAIPSVTIRRLDERTLAIRPKGGYLRWFLDQVFRSERRRFALGEQVRLTGMTVTISSLTADGRPAEATFQFDVPLESPSLIWLCFRGEGFEPFTPPAVGQETELRFPNGSPSFGPAGRACHKVVRGLKFQESRGAGTKWDQCRGSQNRTAASLVVAFPSTFDPPASRVLPAVRLTIVLTACHVERSIGL